MISASQMWRFAAFPFSYFNFYKPNNQSINGENNQQINP